MMNVMLLTQWQQMEDVHDYLETQGVFPSEEWQYDESYADADYERVCNKYYDLLRYRIQYCENLLKEHNSPHILLTLAELYDREDPDSSRQHLYKRSVRYYAIKTIRQDPGCVQAWILLAKAYDWIALLGGDCKSEPLPKCTLSELKCSTNETTYINLTEPLSIKQKRQIFNIERAIHCMKMVCKLEPANIEHKQALQYYYRMRVEYFKPDGVVRCWNP